MREPEHRPEERIATLQAYEILDTPREQDFDELVELAATACGAPIALVSLVDAHRQWFKAETGLGVRETPIEQSVCACVMDGPGPLQIPDLREDPRFASNTLVTGAPHLRFYGGAPLRTAAGVPLGMLCVLDTQPRELTATQLRLLDVLARQVVAQMEARRQAALATQRAAALEQVLARQQQADREQRERERQHHFEVDHVLAGLVIHAADGSLLFANETACSFLGLTREQMAGKVPADPAWCFLREDGSRMPVEEYPVVQVLREGAATGQLVVGVVRTEGALPAWALVRAVPERSAEGALQRVVVSFMDITARKQLEDELRLADQRKDEFLATLAHELRNPLAPIRSAAEALRRTDDPARTQWCADVIRRQARHMAMLLDDLLDVSRISRGKLEIRPGPVSLGEVVAAAQEVALPLLQRKGHHYQAQLPDPQLKLQVDSLRLSQVLGNLLTNAAKYTDAGGRIALEALAGPDGLRIAVRDSGIGLRPEELGSVFRMFTQLGSGAQFSEGGLGIGLALARGIVELHGGRMEVSSDGPGRGATFTVVLPATCLAGELAAAPDAAAQPAEPTTTVAAGVPRRILVADDNVDASEALALLLRGEGHQVELVHRGDQALAALSAQPFDVAFIDIAMPGMDGYEVAQRLRREAGAAQPTLVALTGWGQAQDRARSAAAGFDHHLTKPVDLERVLALI